MIFTRVVSDELSERAGAKVPRRVWHRARSLPAVGMPFDRGRRRLATAVSAILHILLIWLLVRPEALTNLNPDLVEFKDQGGGGPGPAGGGGGGTRGTGGVKFVQVAPPPPPVTPPVVQPILPPIQPVVELPKPVVPEPVIPKIELPKPSTIESKVEVKAESPIVGNGGGTGNDGTKGNGPGTGGGIGTGVGTGRGSGVGPGTGGGKLDYYPCTNIEMPLFPIPVPDKIRGFKLIINFDVDEKGHLIKAEFTPTKDGGYNRKINDMLKTFRFRAGTTLEGVPIRTVCQITYEF